MLFIFVFEVTLETVRGASFVGHTQNLDDLIIIYSRFVNTQTQKPVQHNIPRVPYNKSA